MEIYFNKTMNAEIEDNIRKNIKWSQLPNHIKQILNNSSREYEKNIISFSIKNQLRYRGNLVRYILKDEKRYYERIVAFSRERLMLFPYHLADMIVKGLRITPFNYYISVVEKLIQDERSYDTLPNFTAADCLRLLGIGRNEYIDLMNKARTNKGRLFGKKNVRGLLPKVPCDIFMEPWWRIEVGLVLEDDVKYLNEEEIALIDKLIDLGSQTAGELNYHIVLSLYKKGLIYIDVPVTGVDCIQVPPLQGFVMNRVLGDYFETLLYKIFVSIDEQTTVGELAGVLQINTELVKQAVSLYCRLNFARKLDPETQQAKNKRHATWNNLPERNLNHNEITPLTLNLNKENQFYSSQDIQTPHHENETISIGNTLNRKGHRIAFLFDSTLTAFLMMGNLSPGLKKHAVTMFEVGKLCDESLDSFLLELEKVSVLDAEGEGEARRFFDHAVILRSTVMALKKLTSNGIDLVRLESLNSLDEDICLRLLKKKYKLLVSMAPLSREVRTIISLEPPHLGSAVPEINSLWFKLYLYHITGYGPPSLLLVKGTILKCLPRMFLGYSKLLITTWLHEPAVIPVATILHVNAALQYSSVLIQAYGVHRIAQNFILPFPFRSETLSKNNCESDIEVKFKNHPAIKNLLEFIDLEHNCGYITFIDIEVLDFGCSNREVNVNLGRNNDKHINNKSDKLKLKEPMYISNENFSFKKNFNESDSKLKSSNNYSSSPSSPVNGLLEQQDQLENISDSPSIDILSPNEETINMFSRNDEDKLENNKNSGEIWTLLDCHFGIPLFDVNANTKICDTIVYGGLTNPESLEKLMDNSRKLSSRLLDFISQCLYYPGESMEIMKRGKLVPLPRYNLVFDNGKVSEWMGK